MDDLNSGRVCAGDAQLWLHGQPSGTNPSMHMAPRHSLELDKGWGETAPLALLSQLHQWLCSSARFWDVSGEANHFQ